MIDSPEFSSLTLYNTVVYNDVIFNRIPATRPPSGEKQTLTVVIGGTTEGWPPRVVMVTAGLPAARRTTPLRQWQLPPPLPSSSPHHPVPLINKPRATQCIKKRDFCAKLYTPTLPPARNARASLRFTHLCGAGLEKVFAVHAIKKKKKRV